MKRGTIIGYFFRLIITITFCAMMIGMLPVPKSIQASPIYTGVDTQKLDDFYTSQMAANYLKGMAVVIVDRDHVIYQRAFGMAGKDIPFTPQTPFPISSGSKSFLALAVMQLVEAGEVELDAPIQTYLPWWRVADPQLSSQITIRDLLNHVTGLVSGSGFYDDSSMSNRLPVEASLEDAVRDLRTARARRPLRTSFLYFDGNYWTLAAMVEKISGEPYPQYLKEHIFGPLEMQNSGTIADIPVGIAQGNLTFFGFPISYAETITQKYLVGCCGVITTVEDIAKYLTFQLNDGASGNNILVSPEGLLLMHTARSNVTPFMGAGYAMGWTVEEEDGIKLLEDQGTWATYTTEMTLLPDQGLGIAIFYNQGCFAPLVSGLPPILAGTISLITGGELKSGISIPMYGVILGVIALVTLGLEIFTLVRLPRWARKAQQLPAWRKVLAILLPLLIAGFLSLGFPYLVAYLTAKTFTLRIALLWWTDLAAWILALSIFLVIKAACRLWILIRPVSPVKEPA